ncbi:MAG: ATP-binding protein [Lachnospiraceae bacterium]|nr:ATP-binding protein [Lachnospiraceae bacterium]MBQ9607761.1 ATP-binding protein [Lachnospiraceae bacterium]MBR1523661.1 ATP-binding protein [Lachnospiraceae bacterium]
MLKRKTEKQIFDWLKSEKNKALLIDGARQVGKTYTVRQCMEQSDVDFLEINLLEDTDALRAVSNSRSVQDLTINLSVATGHSLIKGKTVIFIDEVQELKEIVTMIKFWVDDGSYRYILSGSLLGIELKALRSAPVGYVHEIKMYPLDFEEFAIASGISEDVLVHIKDCFKNKVPVGELVHDKMMLLFRRYLVVGGMPQAVQEYIDTGNISRVGDIQRDIINYYKRDFTKYEDDDSKLMLTAVYDRIPSQLLKQNRRFNYADIRKGLRYERIENSFIWLYKSGVVLHAFNSTEPKIALKLNEKSSLVKLYYSDVGLLTYSCGEAMRRDILFEGSGTNLGGIFENAVIQELTSHGFDVYYYNSKKLGELDFVIEYGGRILPVEVKSGKDYYVHSAVNNVIVNKDFGITEAVVFTSFDISKDSNITYYPVYMSAFFSDNFDWPVLDPIEF